MNDTTSLRRLARAAPAVATILLLSSCAAGGAARRSRVPAVQVGPSVASADVDATVTDVDLGMTKQEVIELMGRPGLITPSTIGETWTWTFVESDEWGFLKSKSVSVQIRNGRVFAWQRPSED